MSIRINWVNPNPVFDEIRIYRTAAPFDENTIPTTPIATVTSGLTWLDTTALQNVPYYYTTAIVVNGEVILSPAQYAINMPYTGPGPQELLCGDWSRGLFGLVSHAELFTNEELRTLCLVGTANTANLGWLKFVRNGKILFFPLTHVATNVGWNTMYARGLVFGTDDTGVGPHGLTPVNQRKVLTKGSDNFIIRLPRINDSLDYSGVLDHRNSDWTTLMYTAFNQGYNFPETTVLAEYVTATYFTANVYTPMAEYSGANCAHLNYTGAPNIPGSSCVRATGTYLWRPVLELII